MDKEDSEGFYEREVTRRRSAIENLIKDIEKSVVAGSFKNKLTIGDISRHASILKGLGDWDKDIPTKDVVGNQYFAALTAKKNCHRYSELANQVIQRASSDEDLTDLFELLEMTIPDDIKYYLLNAKRCYFFECYDACIVMIARAIEFSLKEFLKKEGQRVPKPAVMGKLIEAYEIYVGKKDILKYISEVQKMDRNISAHDSDSERKRMTKAEADHSWTALKIILRELLKIDIKVRVEES